MNEYFDYENEGEFIEDPRFVCDECGFADVMLVDIDGRGAAKCMSCGVAYISTKE